ncbi:MAG: Gfo/Idh/MocA family oxidoreductase [Caldilineaceae bacterium]|nr:Gfo/Idh/MocA family oxidoreductase [Caldilineaceae bacterium]
MSESTKKWRVAVIGAGTIVKYAHAPGFQRLPNVELVALCDVNEPRAAQLAQELCIPQVFADYQVMLAKVQPDIVVVATPNIFHKPMTEAALQAGAHVLCEKPLALTYADAKALFDQAAEQHRVLTVGTHFRFTPPMRAAKAHVDGGFFGKIYAARSVWMRRNGIPGFGSWFTNRELAGGGSLLDIGVHTLDRALYLMGYPQPMTVSGAAFAELGPRGMGLGGWGSDINRSTAGVRFDVDDMAWAFVRFVNGQVLQFQVSWASHFPEAFHTEIFGTEGGAYVSSRDKLELYTTLNGQEVTVQSPVQEAKVSSYFQLIENFVRHLDGDPSAEIVTRDQALLSVQIVDAIGRSAVEGREVVL